MDEAARIPQSFDEWRALAATDAARFEHMRRLAVHQLIARAPVDRQERLHCLQWRVDQTRRQARTPLAACLSLSAMMWESVLGERGLLEALHCRPSKPLPRARVLPFRGRD